MFRVANIHVFDNRHTCLGKHQSNLFRVAIKETGKNVTMRNTLTERMVTKVFSSEAANK